MEHLEGLGPDELRARANELSAAAEEFSYLQMVLYLHDEGFIEIDEAGHMTSLEESTEVCP